MFIMQGNKNEIEKFKNWPEQSVWAGKVVVSQLGNISLPLFFLFNLLILPLSKNWLCYDFIFECLSFGYNIFIVAVFSNF